MQANTTMRALLSPHTFYKFISAAGLKSFAPPATFNDVDYPSRHKLRIVTKVPIYPPTIHVFTMQKCLRLMRGPELLHNTLLHKQYGIIATQGGRMKHCHFEVIRHTLLKKMDFTTGFAIWRVQDPWQPISKKSLGVRMGGGKASINHYVSPVKADQVIVEVGGPFEYFEIKRALTDIANKLPFRAIPVSQEILDEISEKKKKLKEENQNPWTWKYLIQNNMLGCHNWISKYDRRWFNEYL
ncbi:39S ribosomal protein L16, mitochondrial [Colletes gigas]|uniref:39S ribosomal protein L16, mitochondrial n=1 Tax=Colletes gigas TaxID=935657 RepID=UPI001C9AD510|nr:39S ribosomal protein L16, mitochondrial [Colletes gigas]XP_043259979.1 39S ribosomal protein L16, mitochondrial [Colletes gigas]